MWYGRSRLKDPSWPTRSLCMQGSKRRDSVLALSLFLISRLSELFRTLNRVYLVGSYIMSECFIRIVSVIIFDIDIIAYYLTPIQSTALRSLFSGILGVTIYDNKGENLFMIDIPWSKGYRGVWYALSREIDPIRDKRNFKALWSPSEYNRSSQSLRTNATKEYCR